VNKMPKAKNKPKRYKIELTTISVLFWGIILFILLAWIFVLGILAGRGSLPGPVSTISDLKNQVKKLQEMVGKKEEYKDIKTPSMDEGPELDFYEKLANKKDEVKRTQIPEKVEEKPDEVTLFKELPEKEVKKETVEKKKEAEEVKKEPEPPPVIDSEQQYTVQIASTGNKEEAEKLINTLVDQGYDAYYYSAVVNGKNYYRIRCGRFEDRNSALKYSRKLEKEKGYKGFVSKVEQ